MSLLKPDPQAPSQPLEPTELPSALRERDARIQEAWRDVLLARLRNQKNWYDGINKAEQSGDLTDIVSLICPMVDQSTRLRLEKFRNDHRVVRKKRGRPKLQTSMKDNYDLAAYHVRKLKENQRAWKEFEGVKIEARVKTVKDGCVKIVNNEVVEIVVKDGEIVETDAREEFNERMARDVQHLLEIKDPIAHVAKLRGLKDGTLAAHMEGKRRWGEPSPKKRRKSKNRNRKPGSAKK
jgi:hypothetical protein